MENIDDIKYNPSPLYEGWLKGLDTKILSSFGLAIMSASLGIHGVYESSEANYFAGAEIVISLFLGIAAYRAFSTGSKFSKMRSHEADCTENSIW